MTIKTIIRTIFFFFALALMPAIASTEENNHYVLVSVAPHQFFVEQIAGSTVNVILMVPAGASSHTFEPTPKQMLNASKADIWFQLGETFEIKATKALKDHQSKMKFVDLRQGLNLIYASDCQGSCCHCHADSADPHIWLSPSMAKIQAITIANALVEQYPENKELYQKNLESFLGKLDTLDQDIRKTLEPLQNRVIMVSHPAYAYFCRDYHLEQLSIEFEGRDPMPQQLTKILEKAKQAHIKTIFIQRQYNNKGARLVADEIGAKVVMLDPYSEDYLITMRDITYHFANSEE